MHLSATEMPKEFGFQILHIPLSKEPVGAHQCKRSFIIALLLLVLACALQKLKAHKTWTSLALQNLTSELSSTFWTNFNCCSKGTAVAFSYPMPPALQTPYRASYSWYFKEEQTKSQTDALGCKIQSGCHCFQPCVMS